MESAYGHDVKASPCVSTQNRFCEESVARLQSGTYLASDDVPLEARSRLTLKLLKRGSSYMLARAIDQRFSVKYLVALTLQL
jgi:hypothetical protein